MSRKWLIVLLLMVTLACNFPGLPTRPFDTPPTETPNVVTPDEETDLETQEPETVEPETDEPDPDESETEEADPEDTKTEEPDTPKEVDPTATDTSTPEPPTATPTATPKPAAKPTLTSTPTPTPTPTAKAVEPGAPLTFNDPAWELVEWHRIPDSGEWEGTLRLSISGGTPPYRSQIENRPIVNGLEVTTKWRLCKAMPATVRVWSADGQQAETGIYVWELGCD